MNLAQIPFNSPVKNISDFGLTKSIGHFVNDLCQQIQQQIRELIIVVSDVLGKQVTVDQCIQIVTYLFEDSFSLFFGQLGIDLEVKLGCLFLLFAVLGYALNKVREELADTKDLMYVLE